MYIHVPYLIDDSIARNSRLFRFICSFVFLDVFYFSFLLLLLVLSIDCSIFRKNKQQKNKQNVGSLWLLNEENELVLFVFNSFPLNLCHIFFGIVFFVAFILNQIFLRIDDHKIHLFGVLVNWFAIISL